MFLSEIYLQTYGLNRGKFLGRGQQLEFHGFLWFNICLINQEQLSVRLWRPNLALRGQAHQFNLSQCCCF